MINLFHFPGLLLGLFCTPFLAAQSAQFTSTECIVYTVYTVYILKGSFDFLEFEKDVASKLVFVSLQILEISR